MGRPLNDLINLTRPLAPDDATDQSIQKLHQDATTLLDLLQQAQVDLKRANDYAQRVDGSQLATLDARADLKAMADDLNGRADLLKDQLATVKEALLGNDITKTYAQQQTVTSALNNAESAVAALQQPTAQVRTYATLLPSSPRRAPNKAAVQEIDTLFKTAQSQIERLQATAGAITAPPQLTSSILRAMCDAIWPAPNLPYILNFYQQSSADLAELNKTRMN
jgi:chromosome segregation ATPase